MLKLESAFLFYNTPILFNYISQQIALSSGIIVMSYAMAVVMSLLFESPVFQLLSLLRESRQKIYDTTTVELQSACDITSRAEL
jgi:hypothetical protein